MTENNRDFTRWYDEDKVVSRCISILKGLQDSLKRKTATFLMEQIINKPPYIDMLPEEILNTIMNEARSRRWYDFDEVVRIFMELLRHSSPETRRKIAIIAITFIEDLVKYESNHNSLG